MASHGEQRMQSQSHGQSGSGCPVQQAPAAAKSGGCPVGLGKANQKPQPAAQEAGPRAPHLPTDRAASSIPTESGSEDPRWMYPSQEQFYNAMKRKGFSPQAEEMQTVVAIHNAVNERAWAEILAWEATLHPECVAGLKLLRFEGKADEPTLKARGNAALGYRPPFDRHDWVVSRCGKEVTYLLDFYHGKRAVAKPVAMHIDARPAADNWHGMWDRVRMPFMRMWQQSTASAGR